jgi:hypothetical protein
VDNSPVRTFANTADSPEGMIWPTVGIPVSTGTSWVNPSIDPATIPRLGLPNVFTAFQTAPYYIASGNPGPAMPDGAVLVNYQASPSSAGQFHAASTSANLAEIAFGGHASAASGGRYLQYFNFSEPTGAGSASANFNVPAFMPLGLHMTGTNAITWTNQTATIDFELPTNSLRLMAKSNNTFLGQVQISGASSDADGRFSEYVIFGEASRGVPVANFMGTGIESAGISVNGTSPILPNSFRLTNNGLSSYLDAIGSAPTTYGGANYRIFGSDGTQGATCMILRQVTNNPLGAEVLVPTVLNINNQFRLGDRGWSGFGTGTANINSDGNSLIINPAGTTGIVFLNWDMGGGGVRFGNGAGGAAVGQVDTAGNAQFNTVTTRDLTSAPSQDFNSMTTGGYYIIGPNANAPPSGDIRNFVVLVMSSPGFQGLAIQMAWNFNVAGEIWSRQLFFGTWTPWVRFNTTPAATVMQGGPKGPLPLPPTSDKEPLLDAPITPGPDRDRTAEAGKRNPQKSVARKPDATSQGRTHKSR